MKGFFFCHVNNVTGDDWLRWRMSGFLNLLLCTMSKVKPRVWHILSTLLLAHLASLCLMRQGYDG